MDLNGSVTLDDIDGFVLGLKDPAAYEATYGVPAQLNGDIDQDGDLDFDDIDDLVVLFDVGASAPAGDRPVDVDPLEDRVEDFVLGLKDVRVDEAHDGGPTTLRGDSDGDGDLDFDDIDDFVALVHDQVSRPQPAARWLSQDAPPTEEPQEQLASVWSEVRDWLAEIHLNEIA
jgi:hypothetical protein